MPTELGEFTMQASYFGNEEYMGVHLLIVVPQRRTTKISRCRDNNYHQNEYMIPSALRKYKKSDRRLFSMSHKYRCTKWNVRIMRLQRTNSIINYQSDSYGSAYSEGMSTLQNVLTFECSTRNRKWALKLRSRFSYRADLETELSKRSWSWRLRWRYE